MKKILTIIAFVGLLTSVSCARKNCPAYSSVQKSVATEIAKG